MILGWLQRHPRASSRGDAAGAGGRDPAGIAAPTCWRLARLALGLLLLTVLTWKKWGNPALDAGAELTTAERIADGAVPYRDIRYFYGPARPLLAGRLLRSSSGPA